jgi:hypothetical protein
MYGQGDDNERSNEEQDAEPGSIHLTTSSVAEFALLSRRALMG